MKSFKMMHNTVKHSAQTDFGLEAELEELSDYDDIQDFIADTGVRNPIGDDYAA